MNTKLLKQKILDLAIRGKLTDQRKSDGTAADLLTQISDERRKTRDERKGTRSKKSGVILSQPKGKKSKDPGTIIPLDKNEAPFEIPANWEWVRLGDVGVYKKGPFGSALTKSMFVPKGPNTIKVYEQKNAIRKNESIGDYYITREYFDSAMKGFEVFPGDILVSCAGTIGETFILPKGCEQGIINQALMKMKIFSFVDVDYFLYYFDFVLKAQSEKEGKGTAIKNIPPFAVFKEFPFPLPPLAEQQRIVEKIEEAFAEIDAIEKNKELLKTHIKQTRQKILDLAIHGKLVPQNKSDEPASVLLERITRDNPHYEKMGLDERRETKDERGFKDKCHSREGGNLLAPISKDEIPFDIPENWVWCRLKDIANYGECDNVEVKRIPETAWILELEDIEKDSGKILHFFSKSERQINGVRHQFEKGDVLYSKLRTYLNKVLVASNDGYCTTEIMPIKTTFISNHYLCMVLRSRYFLDYTAMCGYGVKMPRLSTNDAKNGLIPLPPLNEQFRIVAKIEELFSTLDQMERNLV